MKNLKLSGRTTQMLLKSGWREPAECGVGTHVAVKGFNIIDNRSRDLFERCIGNRSAAKEPVHILRQLKKFSATASRISLYGTCSGDWCCGRRSPGPVHTALLSCCYPYGHPGCCHRSSPALPPGQVESPILTGQGISAMSVRNFLLGF